jgi:tetratricopeptide (TPR) repeat protein
MIGTPQYMSPEQATERRGHADGRLPLGAMLPTADREHAVDPSSLGGSGLAALQRAICGAEPPRPSTRVAGRRRRGDARARPRHDARSFAAPLGTRLDRDEGDRTRAALRLAGQLAADLERHLRNEPVLAGPPSAAYRARKFVRRHRLGVGLAAAAVVVLAGLAATMAAQARRIAAERDRATEVLGYLKQVFEVSDPREARGGEITARELLDKSAARLDAQLADRPELHAEMAATMGAVYWHLGLYDRAEPLFSKALETRRRLLGDRHPDTLASLHDMAMLRRSQGKYDEAANHLREALEGRRRGLGADHPDTLSSIDAMGVLLQDQSSRRPKLLRRRSMATVASAPIPETRPR